MRIGIGLPSAAARSPAMLGQWARAVEAGPFDALAAEDGRKGLEDALVTLAAASPVTERLTLVALVPSPRPAALLAKAAATVQALSGGRLLLAIPAEDGEALTRALRERWRDPRVGSPREPAIALADPDGRFRLRGAATEVWAVARFALGPAAAAGEEVLASAEAVRAVIDEQSAAGCDHLLLLPAQPDTDQIKRLAALL